MRFVAVESFDEWRNAARELLKSGEPPSAVRWHAEGPGLFQDDSHAPIKGGGTSHSVPREFINVAKQVACHCDSARWDLLYRLLWRITHGEHDLLKVEIDDDVHAAVQMQKAVKRDAHKMKAFVRFRKVESAEPEEFVAWHRPDHRIVRLTAPFFARRFKGMRWTILTPDESARWDGETLSYGPGAPANSAPEGDALEEMWRTYYASIFNPARVNVKTMKREMPVRHWPTLPETSLIPELLERAESRVSTMIDTREGFATSAARFIPEQYNLNSLSAAAKGCTACDLHCHATQTVFGEGPANAKIVLVGEQPGDREDTEGRPFVGPAGQLLDEALERAGIDRSNVYVTNVVKHFKYVPRGMRRLHQKPDSREIAACKPWLEAEIEFLRPSAVVCLGATAAQALLGRDFRITKQRGRVLSSEWSSRTIATWHPAAVLRMPDLTRRAEMLNELTSDLSQIAQAAAPR